MLTHGLVVKPASSQLRVPWFESHPRKFFNIIYLKSHNYYMINVAINCLKRLLINFAINFVLNYMINYQLFSPGWFLEFMSES